MAAITKNVFSNQFSISFPIMSCYLLKMTKILYSNLELILDFCDAAGVILSTVFYLLKQVALSFLRHVVQNENCLYNCVGGIIRS